MSATQHLKSVVTLGGAVDSSFSGMASEIDKQLSSATRQVKTLERKQASLTKQIKKGKLAGKDVSHLTTRYTQLGKEIAEAERTARGFSAASSLKQSLKSTGSIIAKTTIGLAGLSATIMGLTTRTNSATAEQVGLAKSYGMTISQFSAWGGIAKQAGLNSENTGDLVEELTNKFGEFKALGKMSAVSDVFGKLGIDKAMLNGMSAAEQFEFVMHRIAKVKDGQEAASLADMLMGGEGSKLVTYLRSTGKSLDSLLATQKSLNHLTNEGANGAVKYTQSLNKVSTVLYSSWQDVVGLVGGEVAPIFEKLALTISDFVDENKDEIVSFFKSAVEGSIAFAGGVFKLAGTVDSVVQSIGGWDTVMAGIAGLMTGKLVVGIASTVLSLGSIISTLGTAKTAMLGLNVVMAANPIGAVAAVVGLLVTAGILLYQNWDKVKAWFKPFFSWFEAKWDKFLALTKRAKEMLSTVAEAFGFGDGDEEKEKTKKKVPSKAHSSYYGVNPSITYNPYNYASRAEVANETSASGSTGGKVVHQKVEKIEVIAAPGQSPKEIAQAVGHELSGEQDAMFDLSMSE